MMSDDDDIESELSSSLLFVRSSTIGRPSVHPTKLFALEVLTFCVLSVLSTVDDQLAQGAARKRGKGENSILL
jgi:hypothetical protein